ncbi:MAG: hypothetical protein GC191_19935 [Azospirillum sp.]|nr:hypothetical protein [Azospirillum sp.]
MKWITSATRMPPARLRKLLWIGAGVALIVSGILIALTPILMGLTCIIIGLYILLRTSADARRLFVRIKRRFPATFRPFDNWRHRHRD